MKNANAVEIFAAVMELADNRLNRPDDLKLLIETAFNQNRMELLEELSFYAKFSSGLLGVIQKREGTVDEEYFKKAADEFKINMEKIRNCLGELLEGSSDFIKNILQEKYLILSQLSLSNLNLLCSDLSYVKLYFIDKRVSGAGAV